MAKVKSNTTVKKVIKSKVRRSGIVSKNNTSSIKTSRNYRKKYRGQGR